jgi:hypothetical protein
LLVPGITERGMIQLPCVEGRQEGINHGALETIYVVPEKYSVKGNPEVYDR